MLKLDGCCCLCIFRDKKKVPEGKVNLLEEEFLVEKTKSSVSLLRLLQEETEDVSFSFRSFFFSLVIHAQTI
tara:strand:- start:252 stop:467 length:216 start_codon:yes stop_codon:yes gene_type:complete